MNKEAWVGLISLALMVGLLWVVEGCLDVCCSRVA